MYKNIDWQKTYELIGMLNSLSVLLVLLTCLVFRKKAFKKPLVFILINSAISIFLDLWGWYYYKIANEYGYVLVQLFAINNLLFFGMFFLYPITNLKFKKTLQIFIAFLLLFVPFIFQLNTRENWPTFGSIYQSVSIILLSLISLYYIYTTNLKTKFAESIIPKTYLFAFISTFLINIFFNNILSISQLLANQIYIIKNIIWIIAGISICYGIIKFPLTPTSTPKPSPPPQALS